MPAPNPPTNLVLTEEKAGNPTITLTWAHAGVDLDRFEVLSRPDAATPWTSYVLAPKADFGAGPYSIIVASRPDTEWAVRALSAAGEVSI